MAGSVSSEPSLDPCFLARVPSRVWSGLDLPVRFGQGERLERVDATRPAASKLRRSHLGLRPRYGTAVSLYRRMERDIPAGPTVLPPDARCAPGRRPPREFVTGGPSEAVYRTYMHGYQVITRESYCRSRPLAEGTYAYLVSVRGLSSTPPGLPSGGIS